MRIRNSIEEATASASSGFYIRDRPTEGSGDNLFSGRVCGLFPVCVLYTDNSTYSISVFEFN